MDERRVLLSCRLMWDQEDEVIDYLRTRGVVADMPRFDGQQLEEDDLLPILKEYDGILAGDDHLTGPVLRSAPRLKVISKWGIGIDAIDLEAARELGIAVFNTPGVFGEELADYAMGFIHLLARRQHEVNERVKAGAWYKVRGVSLAGRVLGIIGLGSSGRELAKRAVASSMQVIGHDVMEVSDIPGCEIVGFDALLESSDIVSLHLPATDATRHLINARAFDKMRRGSWLVNTSRGALIDEAALVEALTDGRVGAAALDVFESEPVSSTNPLLNIDNVIVGSHNGSNTFEAVKRTTRLAIENLLKVLGGGGSDD